MLLPERFEADVPTDEGARAEITANQLWTFIALHY
jgi:hypothetical protein